ncbi:MAG TPA: hypothetical protein VEZ20_15145 [Allosphingosinicella sp.]|nr:hypothetical protein [Allosphingosinicella sp.]
MAKLSLNDAWNDTAAFVKREWRLLVPIALLLNALPMAFATALMPSISPQSPFQPGLWLLAIPVAAFIGIVGNVAICWLAMSSGRSVGEGLKRGVARFLPLFALYLLVGLATGLLFLIVAAIAGLLFSGLDPQSPSPGALAGLGLLLLLVMVPALLVLSVRLMMAAPVAAAEEGGPIAILKRSLALTRPVFWPLLGFLILTTVLSLVVQRVGTAIVGIPILLVAGPPREGGISQVLLLLVGAAIATVVTVYLTTMVARIYLRLAGRPNADVFA